VDHQLARPDFDVDHQLARRQRAPTKPHLGLKCVCSVGGAVLALERERGGSGGLALVFVSATRPKTDQSWQPIVVDAN
jgi:hypothetical protein